MVNILSTGEDATLGNYRKIALALWGEDSPAVKYLDEKIANATHGENEGVIADEGQTLHLLATIHYAGALKKVDPDE